MVLYAMKSLSCEKNVIKLINKEGFFKFVANNTL